ncbi:MAG: mobile mystery protein A [endosymbiont of Seepiophila jonesi]|uniref:Mobile mystery protein A n=1 Tax=endosymbiont of Lamellibrachia luymesi TaxID=2200907 RepID=A0A370DXQ6_9GAMM|nr:MAG: mobile mystery protein A [endosymbiont of Lamellibrachia luymesi]RDH91764.1 MAG: mobile mystery protein A [endosymbiont of Seepiophila jonesi]
MRSQDRATARRQLDKRLSLLPGADTLTRPPRGWIKAIREALGMTTAQLGKRLGVSQPRAVAIEKAEIRGSITLDSLERAAQALDCRLVYTLVPRKPLEMLIEERAHLLAKKRLESTGHSMKLEAQGVDATDESEQLKSLVNKIIAQGGSKLWENL